MCGIVFGAESSADAAYRLASEKIIGCLDETQKYTSWIENSFNPDSEFAVGTLNDNGKLISKVCRSAFDQAKANPVIRKEFRIEG